MGVIADFIKKTVSAGKKRYKRRAYVHAFLAGNLGDDLFVRILCRRYPDVLFCFCADDNYRKRFHDIPNCEFHAPDEFEELVKSADAVVHIGGCCFVQHNDDWTSFYEVDRFLAENAKRLVFLGGNFGPYTDKAYYEAYSQLFKKYYGICFRDTYSRALFREYPNVASAPDIVFGYPAQIREKKKKVLFSPIEFSDRGGKYSITRYGEDYLEFHVRAVKTFIKRGYNVSLVSFCEMQKDRQAIDQILDRLSQAEKEKVFCAYYEFDMEAVIREFEDSECVVATRFHSMILGFIHQCRVLPIIYDQKTEKVLQDLAYPLYLQLSDLKDMEVQSLVDSLLEAEPIDISGLKLEAQKQFQFLDRILKD